MPDVDFLARRICDLMTGQIPTINTITYEGYVHCAALMINGMVEEKAGQIMYLASGKKGSSVPYESCIQVLHCAYSYRISSFFYYKYIAYTY